MSFECFCTTDDNRARSRNPDVLGSGPLIEKPNETQKAPKDIVSERCENSDNCDWINQRKILYDYIILRLQKYCNPFGWIYRIWHKTFILIKYIAIPDLLI